MKNKIVLFLGLFFLLAVIIAYKSWFLSGTITGGDLWYFFPSMYGNYSLLSSAWLFSSENGFGGPSVLFSAVNFILAIPFFFGKSLGISWEILERIFILFPFLFFATFSPIVFFRKIFPNNKIFFISPLIFLFNTYILMLVSGGLIIIGTAYALMPLIYLLFIKIENQKNKLRNKSLYLYSLILGIILGIQSVLDVRVTYVTFLGLLIFFLFSTFFQKIKLHSLNIFLFGILIPGIVNILLNGFWIIPAVLTGSSSFKNLGSAYTSLNSVKFFSFATFENSVSLLHPNWPENIFGKIYFQRPEFLLLPILAFGALFFAKKENKKILLPIAVISLIGSFLAKGANEPFGQIYILLFEKLPGFILFRDPTKWYMLVALSFSILIPFTLFELYKKIGKFGFMVPVGFIIYFIFLINPVFLGRLPGTFKTSVVPKEYINFERFLSTQNNFSRSLWVPSPSRFSYYAPNHPEISGDIYFKKTKPLDIVRQLNKSNLKLLGGYGVRYVLIPSDPRGEIFIRDRKYNEKEYQDTVKLINKAEGLEEVNGFGRLKVYENDFWNQDIKQENSKKVYPRIQQLTDTGSIISFISLLSVLISIIYLKFK